MRPVGDDGDAAGQKKIVAAAQDEGAAHEATATTRHPASTAHIEDEL